MDPPRIDLEIDIDEDYGEWVRHPPNGGNNTRCTFQGRITVWITDSNPPHGPPTRSRLMSPASVTLPTPRRVYRRRRIHQSPAASSSEASVAQVGHSPTRTIDIQEDVAGIQAPAPRGRPGPRRTARMSVRQYTLPFEIPRIDPMDIGEDEVEGNTHDDEEDEEEEEDPSMPSSDV